MLFVLDVGNTNIVLGCIENGNVLCKSRIKTDKNKTEIEYAVVFKGFLDIYNIKADDVLGSIISSVVPPINTVLSEAVRIITGKAPEFVDVKGCTSLKIDMDNPSAMGSDLIVDAVAALASYPPPLIIIDMGTATTISAINKDGVYVGTSIIPGMRLSLEALSGSTSQLPHIDISSPGRVAGKNTVECMKSGAVYGTAAMLDGMIDRLCDELGTDATVIATGGLAGLVVKHCSHDIIYDDELLLKGLEKIYYER